MKFKLSQETQRVLIQARDLLRIDTEKLRDVHNNKSEKWQDSDSGQEVDCWLENLEGLLDSLEDFQEAPDE